ncbi:hypothetical protein [Leptospira santarosai]|uniref:hypothetical protein n=1 Tax=Leptospira santarosai TaxID=28183 RepID=UPI000774C2F1|nr:hypothetical protein [Leptospira santarosai]
MITKRNHVYSDLRYADQMSWNVEDVDTYTGVDRIGLLVPERDMLVDRGNSCGPSGNFMGKGSNRLNERE